MKQIFTCLSVFLFVSLFISSSFGQTNLLPNGDMEDMSGPNFWSKLNGTTECIWADDTSAVSFNGRRSLKIEKTAASSDVIGWIADNSADLYWQNIQAELISLQFDAKTEGVNTAPANDDERIGIRYTFKKSGVIIAQKLVPVDQTTASTSFTSYPDAILLTEEPDEAYAELIMGKDATGTVWFDNVWWFFGGDMELAAGWFQWASDADSGFCNFIYDTSAHSGDYSVYLEKKDDITKTNEMVYYSEPVPANPGKWYRISVWAKTEGINTGDSLVAGNTPEFLSNRLGINFFFHRAPLFTAFDLTGGDQFMWFSQLPKHENTGWTQYNAIAKAPDDAAGVSMRARFANNASGKVWYDDFSIEELIIDENDEMMVNGDMEDISPNFWSKLNATTESTWADDTSAVSFNGRRSLKIEKTAASSDVIGWIADNSADLYWQNIQAELISLQFDAKTEGVNTAPANDDERIGVRYTFKKSGAIIAQKLVPVDQTTASTSFTSYPDAILLTEEPDEAYAELIMGKDATGTVWFDNVWWFFGGDMELAAGWFQWASDADSGFCNFIYDTSAHSGDYSVYLEKKDDITKTNEMVYYSEPVPAEPNEWYRISVWAKTAGINTGDDMVAGNTPEFLSNRLGINFFFHRAPLFTAFDLTGGDQFMWFSQLPKHENTGWTQYNAIAKAPEDAAGVSMRARFANNASGQVWYDDFSIKPVQVMVTALETPQKSITLTPSDFKLKNNYPNPFNPETIIEYLVPKNGQVKLVIYNMLGQKVRTLVNEVKTAGTYQVFWNGRNEDGTALSSGVYFYQLQGENALITKKMTLIK